MAVTAAKQVTITAKTVMITTAIPATFANVASCAMMLPATTTTTTTIIAIIVGKAASNWVFATSWCWCC